MQIEEQIIGVLTDTRDRIRETMEEKGINATGRTSLSIRVRKVGNAIQLVGGGESSAWGGAAAPFETIEIGNGPGGDYHRLRIPIYKWTNYKGMTFMDDSHRWAVSTNIAKNIVEKGTRRYRNHEDVYTSDVLKTADELRKKLFDGVREELLLAVSSINVETNTNRL